MKYILMCVLALVVCVGVSLLLTWLIGKKFKLKKGIKALLTAGFSVLILLSVSLGYLGNYYKPDSGAADESPNVIRERVSGGYFFDGPGEDKALIFYPGAKVAALAYAPLMNSLAENGVDCFLADMPFHMAMFGSNTADKFMKNYTYEKWYAAGHSMGGLVISGYASKHSDQIDGLILLASYPGSNIPNWVPMCSIYGSDDGCLNREAYEKAKVYWSIDAEEHIIEGGNHAQFAHYGPQSGDLEAKISRDDQQNRTREIILEFINN